MTTTEPTLAYPAYSRWMLQIAARMVECGDRRQASKQIWEAAAQRVSEIADERGWPNISLTDTYAISHHISVHAGERQISILFALASDTGRNFYEDWFSLDEVNHRLEAARTLFALLDEAHRTLPLDLPMPNEPFYRERHT